MKYTGWGVNELLDDESNGKMKIMFFNPKQKFLCLVRSRDKYTRREYLISLYFRSLILLVLILFYFHEIFEIKFSKTLVDISCYANLC